VTVSKEFADRIAAAFGSDGEEWLAIAELIAGSENVRRTWGGGATHV
jgi:hypothetical protein